MASIPFSDTTNKNGIIQLCELNCGLGDAGISGDTTLLKQFTALTNISMSEVWHAIFRSSGSWIYDDSNQTDLPQATTDMVAGTAKYSMPASAVVLDRVEVKDNDGNWRVLRPLDLTEIKVAVDEFFDTDGFPTHYRLIGRTLELFPAPSASNVTLTEGLKVYFRRGGVVFAYDDTTEYPGFASEYHDLIPIKTSIKWLQVNKPDSGTLIALKGDEVRRVAELEEFIREQFKSKRPQVLKARPIKSR